MTPHEVLVAARELIADERNWIKGKYSTFSPEGKCYCAYGAAHTIFARTATRHATFDGAWAALTNAVPREDLGPIEYNDEPDTTHADVLAMFDRAIEATAS